MKLNPPTFNLSDYSDTVQISPADGSSSDQRSSSWIVAVVSFNEPAAMYDPNKGPDGQGANTSNPTISVNIIDDELMGVTVSNSKHSFGKMASIQVKPILNWYPALIAPGDWVFVWMASNQRQINYIKSQLVNLKASGALDNNNALCDATSGLKFSGRVLRITSNNTMSGNGFWTINQSIECQSFLEFATSVYYTYTAQAVVASVDAPNATSDSSPFAIMGVEQKAVTSFLGDIAQQFISAYSNPDAKFAPDDIIGNYYCTIMGTDPTLINVSGLSKQLISGHTRTSIPKEVAIIMGKPQAQWLYELIEVQLGLQQFSNSNPQTTLGPNASGWWNNFQPDFADDLPAGPIKQTPIRTKGFVPYRPALWDNQSMWAIFGQYVNDVCNEMYTVMRINSDGRITPTFIVREKPFSTGLFNQFLPNSQSPDMVLQRNQGSLGANAPVSLQSLVNPIVNQFDSPINEALNSQGVSTPGVDSINLSLPPLTIVAGKAPPKATLISGVDVLSSRTFFGQVPRWVIDYSLVRDYSYAIDEGSRVNFVQVWGTSDGLQFIGNTMSPESFKGFQFDHGNYQIDYPDVQRHGLRAHIINSQYDTFISSSTVTFTPAWASMNADWLFNGHLKANATVRMNGTTAPICEGDNAEIDGMVYHIESVTHTGSISNGQKSFETILQLSNGIQSSTLTDSNDIPRYVAHFSDSTEDNAGPGNTDIVSDNANANNNTDPINSNPALNITGPAMKDMGKI